MTQSIDKLWHSNFMRQWHYRDEDMKFLCRRAHTIVLSLFLGNMECLKQFLVLDKLQMAFLVAEKHAATLTNFMNQPKLAQFDCCSAPEQKFRCSWFMFNNSVSSFAFRHSWQHTHLQDCFPRWACLGSFLEGTVQLHNVGLDWQTLLPLEFSELRTVWELLLTYFCTTIGEVH